MYLFASLGPQSTLGSPEASGIKILGIRLCSEKNAWQATIIHLKIFPSNRENIFVTKW